MQTSTVYKPEEVKATEAMLREKGLLSGFHINKIDLLVPQAMKNADNRMRKHLKKRNYSYIGMETPGGQPWRYDIWTEFYCDEMNRLTIAAGLRCQ
jgi:hypothetical protein